MLYNRVLKPADYNEIQPQVAWFAGLIADMNGRGLNTALNHEHRRWEYGFAKHLIEGEGESLAICDIGTQASPLGIGLKLAGHEVWETDSCAYGNPVDRLIRQCIAYDVRIPWVPEPVEAMPGVPSDYFDVVTCISVMEHVDPEREKDAWLEMKRILKPGGVLFATMDFHPDGNAINTPYKAIQQTIYTKEHLEEVLGWLRMRPVGPAPTWEWHGSAVHNYSFCSLAVRKWKRK